MLKLKDARLQVAIELQQWNRGRSGPEEFVILDEHTIERPWGWVFFYTTRGWLDGDDRYIVAGNGPFIVNCHSGVIRAMTTAQSIEHQIAEYEVTLANDA